jgi:hypothetical protein
MELEINPENPATTIVTYEDAGEYVMVKDISFKDFLSFVLVGLRLRKSTQYPRQEVLSNDELEKVKGRLRYNSDWNFEHAQEYPREADLHIAASDRYAAYSEQIEDYLALVS